VEAVVAADAVEVQGEIKGEVRARSVTLAEKARVQGTVDARVLVVKEGAWLSGSVTAGEGASKTTPATPPAPPPPPPGDKAGA
jgi:cytoskeletal protein CcmA (bactofilin family)